MFQCHLALILITTSQLVSRRLVVPIASTLQHCGVQRQGFSSNSPSQAEQVAVRIAHAIVPSKLRRARTGCSPSVWLPPAVVRLDFRSLRVQRRCDVTAVVMSVHNPQFPTVKAVKCSPLHTRCVNCKLTHRCAGFAAEFSLTLTFTAAACIRMCYNVASVHLPFFVQFTRVVDVCPTASYVDAHAVCRPCRHWNLYISSMLCAQTCLRSLAERSMQH